jgi:hypothetical protein
MTNQHSAAYVSRARVSHPRYGPVPAAMAFLLVVLCLLALADGIVPQLQLFWLGHLVVGEYVIKAALLALVIIGCLVLPERLPTGAPAAVWWLCVAYLLADCVYLNEACQVPMAKVFQSYAVYYALLLGGAAMMKFRGRVSHKTIVWSIVLLFLTCAVVAALQYFKQQPLLYTESPDGGFTVASWGFFGEIRAFSLFTSSWNFGVFCALCGALGVALSRRFPLGGISLLVLSAFASFTTLTRLSYLTFACACSYALVLSFGRNPRRGLWQPILYFVLGIATILVGLYSFVGGSGGNLRDATSLLARLAEWSYYSDLFARSTLTKQLFGLGIVQNEDLFPMIDNQVLALVLHIGAVGLVLFSVLLIKMWLYLRREAIATQQPLMIAAASLWASMTCAGTFDIVLSLFGTVFAIAILCRRERGASTRLLPMPATRQIAIHSRACASPNSVPRSSIWFGWLSACRPAWKLAKHNV